MRAWPPPLSFFSACSWGNRSGIIWICVTFSATSPRPKPRRNRERWSGRRRATDLVTSTIMPQNGARLTDWNFQHGELDFTMTSAAPIDAVANVRTLEAVAGFSNVSLVRSNGDRALKIKLKVAPR
jgi:hypothetical protein